MGEQIGSRSRLTPEPLLCGDAGICGGPASPCTGQAAERIASLPAGMLRAGYAGGRHPDGRAATPSRQNRG